MNHEIPVQHLTVLVTLYFTPYFPRKIPGRNSFGPHHRRSSETVFKSLICCFDSPLYPSHQFLPVDEPKKKNKLLTATVASNLLLFFSFEEQLHHMQFHLFIGLPFLSCC